MAWFESIGSNGGGGSSSHNYSTTEQVVGTWIDGRTVYEKTIDCGLLSNKSQKDTAHGISNLDVTAIVSIESTANNGSYAIFFPRVHDTTFGQQAWIAVTTTNIEVYNRGADLSGWRCYVTMRYCKTS